jgi:hypothetical protein
MESRTTPGPASLRHREAVTACLRRAGFSIRLATHSNWLLDSYIYGFALQEANLPFAGADELADLTESVYLPQLPPEDYPYLNEAATELMQAGYNPADEFTYGLTLILDAWTVHPSRRSHRSLRWRVQPEIGGDVVARTTAWPEEYLASRLLLSGSPSLASDYRGEW